MWVIYSNNNDDKDNFYKVRCPMTFDFPTWIIFSIDYICQVVQSCKSVV